MYIYIHILLIKHDMICVYVYIYIYVQLPWALQGAWVFCCFSCFFCVCVFLFLFDDGVGWDVNARAWYNSLRCPKDRRR